MFHNSYKCLDIQNFSRLSRKKHEDNSLGFLFTGLTISHGLVVMEIEIN